MKFLDLGLAEKGLTGEKEKNADPKKKDFVVGIWWCRDHSCSPVSLNSVRRDLVVDVTPVESFWQWEGPLMEIRLPESHIEIL